jgi:hypothetical protein
MDVEISAQSRCRTFPKYEVIVIAWLSKLKKKQGVKSQQLLIGILCPLVKRSASRLADTTVPVSRSAVDTGSIM